MTEGYLTKVYDVCFSPNRNSGMEVVVSLPETIEKFTLSDLKHLKGMQMDGDAIASEVQNNFERFTHEGKGAIATREHPICYAAGGILPVFADERTGARYLGFVSRTDQSRLSALAGRSESLDEIHDPRLLMEREGMEEGLTLHRNTVLIPSIGGNRDMSLYITEVKVLIPEFCQKSYDYEFLANQSIIFNRDTVFVHGSSFPCIVSWDPSKAALDFIQIFDYGALNVDKLTFYDTEKNNGLGLHRDLVFVPFSVLEKRSLEDCLVFNGHTDVGVVGRKSFADYTVGYTGKRILERMFP